MTVTNSVSGTFKDRGDLTPDTSCKLWYKCNSDAGLTNQILGGDDGVVGADLATAGTMLTTRVGFATTIDNADHEGSFEVPSDNISWDKNATNSASRQSLIIHMRLIGDAPAANNYIMSSYPSGGGGSGIRISGLTTGVCNPEINDTTSGAVASGGSTGVVLDGTEHSLCVIVNAETDMMTTYIDGVADSTGAYNIDVSSVVGDTDLATYPYHFGSNASSGVSWDLSFREIQIYTPTNLPADQTRLARKLHSRPFTPLTSEDLT